METNILLISIMIVLALVVVFIVFRELFTWYWKINKIVTLLEKILHKLEEKDQKTVS